MRNSVTLAMLTAAVGVPYTATETELGRSALQTFQSQTAELAKGSKAVVDAANAHREVELILEQGVQKYRYPDPPQVLAGQMTVPYVSGSTMPGGILPKAGGAAASVAGGQSPGAPGGQGAPAGIPGQRASYGVAGNPANPSTPGGLAANVPNPVATPGGQTGGLSGGLYGGLGAGQPPGTNLGWNGPSLVGGPIHDLREVLRFDVTPDWVTSRFSRVSTVLAETQLEGLRVPLVTGIGTADLAGTLTYYFDYNAKLQRIMMHALTGDVSRLMETMRIHYGLEPESTLDAGVYTRRWNNVPVHFLRVTRAPVVYADALHHKFTIFIELNQPDLRFGISEEANKIIDTDRRTGRW